MIMIRFDVRFVDALHLRTTIFRSFAHTLILAIIHQPSGIGATSVVGSAGILSGSELNGSRSSQSCVRSSFFDWSATEEKGDEDTATE